MLKLSRLTTSIFLALILFLLPVAPGTYSSVGTAQAGVVTKSIEAYVSSRLLRAMFLNGSSLLRKRAADAFFAVIKKNPDLAPKALRMVETFARSPKVAQHLANGRGAELESELETAMVRLRAWNKPVVDSEGKIANIMRDAHRSSSDKALVGSGSTADALRFEKETGTLVGGKGHATKSEILVGSITDYLEKSGSTLSKGDREQIGNVLSDLRNAMAKP